MLDRNTPRILNVDDTDATRYMVTKALRSAGFEVMEAVNGKDCFKLVGEKPDLVVLDIQLPDISGLEICERLKSDPSTASIPILHVSATHISGEDQAEGLEGGAEGYLTHPIDPLVLVATVKALLRAKVAEQKMRDTVHTLELERSLREQFVATLTHDLRNPLSAAKTTAQMLARNGDDPARRLTLVSRIVQSVDRADQMITNLLDANRIRAGESIPLTIQPLDLTRLVRETLDELSSLYEERFVLHSPAEVQGFWCPIGLRRVVENLATNAIKYGADHRPITVTLTQPDTSVVLSVHNEGPSLSGEEQVRLFEPFHRSFSAKQSGSKGWGLGLTLVRGIAEAHKGTAGVESSPEKGTTFSVRLPLDSR